MLNGIPVIASVSCTRSGSPTENIVAAIDGAKVVVADDGEVGLSASSVASLQMDDAPSNEALTPTASTQVSMFQTNSTALKLVRWLNFERADDSAVAWMTSLF